MKSRSFLLAVIVVLGISTPARSQDPVLLDPFHSITVSSEIIAELVKGEKDAFEVDFEEASPDDLKIRVEDSVLKLSMRTGSYKDARLRIKVHYAGDLKYLEASGQGQIFSADSLKQDGDLSLKLFKGGEMRFSLVCDSLHARLSQGSILALKGKSRALTVKATTNATFSGYEFDTEMARVVSSGTGKAKVSVSKYLHAEASTKGFVGYVGEPEKKDLNTRFGGEIVKTFLEE